MISPLLLKQMTDYRVRKSLTALKGTDERRGYFYCLKMLGILPPPLNSGFEKWVYQTIIGQRYTPKSLHDVLISSHATSCEHHSFYFSFYHRHLMILSEIFLNFAHNILRGRQQRLIQIYSKHPQFDELYNKDNQNLWKEVFDQYNNLKGIPQQVAHHFWNPTNYLSDDDLKIPDELKPNPNPNAFVDPIDQLYQAINSAFPWELNIPRRWSDKQTIIKKQTSPLPIFVKSPPQMPLIVEDSGQLEVDSTLQRYRKLFLAGQLDPRENYQVYASSYQTNISRNPLTFLDCYSNYNGDKVLNRNYTLFNDSKQNYHLNGIKEDQSLSIYGARSKNLQYVSINDLNNIPGILPEQKGKIIQNYNYQFPHYQYANALFNSTMKEFIIISRYQISGEVSHDTMHDNFGYIFSDGSYSITSLAFWPYHSWIDAQIEIKLRRGNQIEGDIMFFQNTLSKSYIKSNDALKSVFKSVTTVLEKLPDWQTHGSQEQKASFGEYPILEWIIPQVRNKIPPRIYDSSQLSPAFYSRDYILKNNRIRTSQQFNEIYQNLYCKIYKSRYWFFPNIENFNFNYNYQFQSSPSLILDQKGQNIPKYLRDMEKDVKEIQRSLKQGFKQGSNSQRSSESSKVRDPQLQFAEQLNIRKVCSGGIKLYATYPSDTKNGHNYVFLKFKNILSKIHNKLSEKQLNNLELYIQKGICVYDIFIFGKENFSDTCYKCSGGKLVYTDIDNNLRIIQPLIWKHIHLDSLNQVYFDSTNTNLKLRSVYEKLSLVEDTKFTNFKLVGGAQEILVDVVSDIPINEGAKFVRLDAHSFSVSKGTVKSVLSKKYNTFKQNFDFFKIHDLEDDSERLFYDHFIYRTLKGWVSVGDHREKFEIQIPNYQRLLRLTLQINLVEGQLRLRLVDKDFNAKRVYYEVASRVFE